VKDLKSRKWEQAAAQVEFKPDIMSSHLRTTTDPAFLTTYSEGGSRQSHRAAFRCVKCGEMRPLEKCPNCDSLAFKAGFDTEGVPGVFCFKCDRGFVSWTCDDCGTENPVKNSIHTEKKGCFIATAAFGQSDAPEVLVLRRFRDQVLDRSLAGRVFITKYYELAPIISRCIANRPLATWLVRNMILRPIVILVSVTANAKPVSRPGAQRT
jgi:hypothetical protein